MRDGETVLVHGDYDVDGMCSTTLLTRVAARARRATSCRSSRIASTDGYDLTDAGRARGASTRGATRRRDVRLRHERASQPVADAARGRASTSSSSITTSRAGARCRRAVAVLNPKRPGCAYPDKDLVRGRASRSSSRSRSRARSAATRTSSTACSISWRSRRSPTSRRCAARTACSRATASSMLDESPQPRAARAHPRGGARRQAAHRGPRRASSSRRGSTRSAGSATRCAASSCC